MGGGKGGRGERGGQGERGGLSSLSGVTVGGGLRARWDIRRKEAMALAAGNDRCRGPDHTPADAPRRMPRSPGQNDMPAGLWQSRAATARGTTSGNGEPPAPASRSRAVGRRPSAAGGGSRARCRPAGRDQIARPVVAGVALGPDRASLACQGRHSRSMSPRPVLAAAGNGTRASGPTGAEGLSGGGSVGTDRRAPQGRFLAGFAGNPLGFARGRRRYPVMAAECAAASSRPWLPASAGRSMPAAACTCPS